MHCPRWFQPVSMHAEMHAIFSFTGMSPSFKTQVQGMERRVSPATYPKPQPTKGTKGRAGLEGYFSGPTYAATVSEYQREYDGNPVRFVMQL